MLERARHRIGNRCPFEGGSLDEGMDRLAHHTHLPTFCARDAIAERRLCFGDVRSTDFDANLVAEAQRFEVIGLCVPYWRYPGPSTEHFRKWRPSKCEKRSIGVVEHLEDSGVKNYTGSVYILKTNRTAIHEGARS